MSNRLVCLAAIGIMVSCAGTALGQPAYSFEEVVSAGGPAGPDGFFGLGASVWTQDKTRGENIARRIKAGATFVNAQVRSDVRLPFGGTKSSGFGRELAEHGIHEFMNIKTVYVDYSV